MNKIVHSTSTQEPRTVHVPLPADERTCRNCGTDEKIRGHWHNKYGWWVRLDCTHVQDDDEY